MYCQELELKELEISIAVSLSLHQFNFVVRSLEWSGADGMVVPGQDSLTVFAQGVGELLELPDTGHFGPTNPVFEELLACQPGPLSPDLTQVLLEVICDGQGFIELEGLVQSLTFRAFIVEVLGPFEQQPADSLEDRFLQRVGGLAVQLPTQFREMFIEQFHEMKAIEDQGSLRQILTDGRAVGRGQIRSHRLDFGVRGSQASPELCQGRFTFSLTDIHDIAAIEIQYQRQIFVSLSDVDLINGNPF
jgi:hypothetical protein